MAPGTALDRLLGLLPASIPAGKPDLILMVAIVQDDKHFLIFPPSRPRAALLAISRWEMNPGLNFTHFAAACMSHRIQEMTGKAT